MNFYTSKKNSLYVLIQAPRWTPTSLGANVNVTLILQITFSYSIQITAKYIHHCW